MIEILRACISVGAMFFILYLTRIFLRRLKLEVSAYDDLFESDLGIEVDTMADYWACEFAFYNEKNGEYYNEF